MFFAPIASQSDRSSKQWQSFTRSFIASQIPIPNWIPLYIGVITRGSDRSIYGASSESIDVNNLTNQDVIISEWLDIFYIFHGIKFRPQ